MLPPALPYQEHTNMVIKALTANFVENAKPSITVAFSL
jgi:hypothetical protein